MKLLTLVFVLLSCSTLFSQIPEDNSSRYGNYSRFDLDNRYGHYLADMEFVSLQWAPGYFEGGYFIGKDLWSGDTTYHKFDIENLKYYYGVRKGYKYSEHVYSIKDIEFFDSDNIQIYLDDPNLQCIVFVCNDGGETEDSVLTWHYLKNGKDIIISFKIEILGD